MAGYRDFQTGEVLTAANVNDFLMEQSVMKFADAAARDSALGTAVGGGNALAEGMVSYLDDVNVVQVYDGSAWASPLPGIGSNVVQAVKTDTFSTTSATFTTVTGLSASITPTSSSSKVLVMCSVPYASDDAGSAQNGSQLSLFRAGSNLLVPDSPSDRSAAFFQLTFAGLTRDIESVVTVNYAFLDSPATTSATTYDVRMKSPNSATAYVNRSVEDNDNERYLRGVATLTVIEVAA